MHGMRHIRQRRRSVPRRAAAPLCTSATGPPRPRAAGRRDLGAAVGICLGAAIWICLGGASLFFPGAGAAAAAPPSEHEVQAAFIHKFTSFIEWPHYSFHYDDSPFVVGILGEDPFGGALEAIVRDEDYDGRAFEIRRFESYADVGHCQILYVDERWSSRAEDLWTQIERDGLLTISSHEGFTRAGGVLRFFVEENRVRFEINIAAAQFAHLKISSKLLSLARVVDHAPKGGLP
ncbi:MAG: DUF4154 domain-containing protein [Candidatus Eisenbacteria bacterium]|nr:DUF4154 domain-containing protein [Candidatus Eisenbacteria bacterium]